MALDFPAAVSEFNQFVVSSYADADWLFTLRPRLGITANNWLLYVTGGLALTKLRGQFLFTDGNEKGGVTGAVQEADVASVRAGYAFGGGVETALTNRLSLKAEYLLVKFGNVTARQVSSNFLEPPPAPQNFTQTIESRSRICCASG